MVYVLNESQIKKKEKKFTTWLEMEICSGIPGRWALLQRWGISLTKHWPVSHHLDLKVTWRACGVKTTPGEGGDVDHELTTSEFTVCASVKLWQCVWCMMVRCYILLRSELLLIPYVRVNRRSGRMLTEIYSFFRRRVQSCEIQVGRLASDVPYYWSTSPHVSIQSDANHSYSLSHRPGKRPVAYRPETAGCGGGDGGWWGLY